MQAATSMLLKKTLHRTGSDRRLEHLAIPHLDRKEDHGDCGDPNATSTKPENTRAFVGKQTSSSERRNYTGDTAQARQHTAGTSTIGSVEQLRGRRI